MKAMLLSAGLGTRLRPLTNTIPKCLVSINGRPLLDYWLHGLFASGVERVLVNLHYFPDKVTEFIEQSRFRDRIDMVMEKDLLGTAGTLKENQSFFGNEPFLVAHADNFCITDFTIFFDAHEARPIGTQMTMMTFETLEPSQCGIVELDEKECVLAFHEKQEKPPGNLANAAVYIMEPEVLNITANLEKDLLDISLDIVPVLIPNINTWQNRECHIDVGTAERYKAANVAAKEFEKRIIELHWF